MPIVNYSTYRKMLKAAHAGSFAYPAINVTSTSTANAALQAFSEARSDGIVQVSIGGGTFASGQGVKDAVLGAISLAEHVQIVADKLDVNIVLHTDHCPPDQVDSFLVPLIEASQRRRKKGLPPYFQSHMFDGSILPLKENLKISQKLLRKCAKNKIILEVETGVVGGEEDGVDNSGQPSERLYTTPDEMVSVYEKLAKIGEFLLAATFGNVHGVYKPGQVKLKPSILKDGQEAVAAKCGKKAKHHLVFHGGSGSSLEEIHETLKYGVIKMNVDTDTQFAYTHEVASYMKENQSKVTERVGAKKIYDPRAWMKRAENGMKDRVIQACRDLKSRGKSGKF